MFFECSQNSQENICARISFLIKLSFWHRSFPVNFANILRTTFLQQHLRITASVFRTMQKKANVISFHKTCGWSVSWFWIYGKVLEQLIFNIIFELLKENELSEFMFTSVRFHTCWHLFARTDFDHPGNVRKSHPEVFCKKVFLEISQNSQESTCARASFLIKLQALASTPLPSPSFIRPPVYSWFILVLLSSLLHI